MSEHLSLQLTRAIRTVFQESLERRAVSTSSRRSLWIGHSCYERPSSVRRISARFTAYDPSIKHLPRVPTRYNSTSNGLQGQTAKRTSPQDGPAIETIPASTSSALPSHTERQRWNVSKQWSSLMDGMLARASIAGQHINVYTGTDYSGIEALRNEIISKESEVRKQHVAVADAKDEHAQARTKQAASQKEIVGLLERKSSWTPSDLERYMTLVRSEHLDDQAVQKAAEGLAMAERQLEATRALLEKLERQQYHEEQIWSDTIRRNSTWVTIGLMGINIVLLLAQISVFEPYRRRKIVDQIEQALEQRMASIASLPIALPADAEHVSEQKTVAAVPSERDGQQEVFDPGHTAPLSVKLDTVPESISAVNSNIDEGLMKRLRIAVNRLFGEQVVQMKEYDRTLLAVESAITGMGVAFALSVLMLRFG